MYCQVIVVWQLVIGVSLTAGLPPYNLLRTVTGVSGLIIIITGIYLVLN